MQQEHIGKLWTMLQKHLKKGATSEKTKLLTRKW